MLLSCRDVLVATGAAALTLAVAVTARSAPGVMTSSVFEWSAMKAEPTAVGQVRHVFRTPTATLDELECHVTTLNPLQTTHAPHTHANEEVIVVREGNVEAFYEGTWHAAGPGSVIFYSSNMPHSLRNVGTTPATYHVVSWHSPGMLKKPAASSAGASAPADSAERK